jgi:hypothetical protein
MGTRFLIPVVALITSGVSGCGTISDQLLSDPRRYTVYACSNVDAEMKATRDRILELEQLMSRASQATGGEVANVIAYRSEYLQNKSRLTALVQAAAEKKCATESEYLSGRSVY